MTRPHPRTLAAASVFVAGTLSLVACSTSAPSKAANANTDSAPANTSTASTQQPAPNASGAATASDASSSSAPAASAPLHACVLVGEQDATTALGADPGVGKEDTQNGDFGGNSRCSYTVPSGGVQVSASSIAGQGLCEGNRQSNSVDVPGVGDKAFETPATSPQEATVYFLKGDTCVSITIEAGSTGSAKDLVIALAKTAAARV